MSGETDLARLLAGLDPVLHEGVYVFATLHEDSAGLEPIMIFAEDEARTVIAPASAWPVERGHLRATGAPHTKTKPPEISPKP